ncbi:MAG: hypothetical protein EZS28_011988 [Streblomastix strix]|uniref:E3 ubiquitin-protein ligase n=1 Tax=Streblomastix strix TaxID=222440 RepID=A0A5J4WCT3_9EUKA|nr:MAG: hypothetical protein EZS28_011988 [Streblomastix strix]
MQLDSITKLSAMLSLSLQTEKQARTVIQQTMQRVRKRLIFTNSPISYFLPFHPFHLRSFDSEQSQDLYLNPNENNAQSLYGINLYNITKRIGPPHLPLNSTIEWEQLPSVVQNTIIRQLNEQSKKEKQTQSGLNIQARSSTQQQQQTNQIPRVGINAIGSRTLEEEINALIEDQIARFPLHGTINQPISSNFSSQTQLSTNQNKQNLTLQIPTGQELTKLVESLFFGKSSQTYKEMLQQALKLDQQYEKRRQETIIKEKEIQIKNKENIKNKKNEESSKTMEKDEDKSKDKKNKKETDLNKEKEQSDSKHHHKKSEEKENSIQNSNSKDDHKKSKHTYQKDKDKQKDSSSPNPTSASSSKHPKSSNKQESNNKESKSPPPITPNKLMNSTPFSNATASIVPPLRESQVVQLKRFAMALVARRLHYEHPFTTHIPLHRLIGYTFARYAAIKQVNREKKIRIRDELYMNKKKDMIIEQGNNEQNMNINNQNEQQQYNMNSYGDQQVSIILNKNIIQQTQFTSSVLTQFLNPSIQNSIKLLAIAGGASPGFRQLISAEDSLLLAQEPLHIFMSFAQLHSGRLWLRNGESMEQILRYYYHPVFWIRQLIPDIFTLQACASTAGWTRFFTLALSLYDLDFFFLPPWYWTKLAEQEGQFINSQWMASIHTPLSQAQEQVQLDQQMIDKLKKGELPSNKASLTSSNIYAVRFLPPKPDRAGVLWDMNSAEMIVYVTQFVSLLVSLCVERFLHVDPYENNIVDQIQEESNQVFQKNKKQKEIIEKQNEKKESKKDKQYKNNIKNEIEQEEDDDEDDDKLNNKQRKKKKSNIFKDDDEDLENKVNFMQNITFNSKKNYQTHKKHNKDQNSSDEENEPESDEFNSSEEITINPGETNTTFFKDNKPTFIHSEILIKSKIAALLAFDGRTHSQLCDSLPDSFSESENFESIIVEMTQNSDLTKQQQAGEKLQQQLQQQQQQKRNKPISTATGVASGNKRSQILQLSSQSWNIVDLFHSYLTPNLKVQIILFWIKR